AIAPVPQGGRHAKGVGVGEAGAENKRGIDRDRIAGCDGAKRGSGVGGGGQQHQVAGIGQGDDGAVVGNRQSVFQDQTGGGVAQTLIEIDHALGGGPGEGAPFSVGVLGLADGLAAQIEGNRDSFAAAKVANVGDLGDGGE